MKQVLYFTAQWCTACQGMTPIVEQLKKTKVIPVEKIDTDYDVTLTEQYNVTSIPTTVVLEDGKEIKRYSGALSYEQLNKLING